MARNTLDRLLRFVAQRPLMEDVDEILDAFGALPEERVGLKKGLQLKCNELLRDDGRMERRRRAKARAKPRTVLLRRAKAPKARRALARANSSIEPALLAIPLGSSGLLAQTQRAIQQLSAELTTATTSSQDNSSSSELTTAGGLGAGSEEQQVAAEPVPDVVPEPVPDVVPESLPGIEESLSLEPRRVFSEGDAERVAEEGTGWERAAANAVGAARAKVRFLLQLDPGVHEQVYRDVALQMRALNRLLPEDSGVKLSWRDVDLLLLLEPSSLPQVPFARALAAPVPPSSDGDSPVRFASHSPEQPLPPPANRIQLARSLLLKDMANAIVGMREEDQVEFARRLSSLESHRLQKAVEFVKELRMAKVPDHAAALRVEEVEGIGNRELSKAASAAGEAEPRGVQLRKRTCEYNCEAMRQSIHKLLSAQLAATLVSSLIASNADPNIVALAQQQLADANSQALAVIDYLNQGMKKARML